MGETMPGMEIFEKVRDFLGGDEKKWTKYRLSKELGISQTSYNQISTEAHSVRLDVLFRLQEICGWDDRKFWGSVREEVLSRPIPKRGKRAEGTPKVPRVRK